MTVIPRGVWLGLAGVYRSPNRAPFAREAEAQSRLSVLSPNRLAGQLGARALRMIPFGLSTRRPSSGYRLFRQSI